MKTSLLVVMSAFLLSAAGPVFALTNQQLACQLAQVGCPVEAKSFERGSTLKSEIKSRDQFSCELAQVGCAPETKSFAQKTTDFKNVKSIVKDQDPFVCELAQVSCPAEAKSH
jgi:hypothetical protein